MNQLVEAKCECAALPDLTVVPMGGDDLDVRVFATLKRVRDRGEPRWWLYLSNCSSCGQNWLVAQEERIFDDYFLKRVSVTEAENIVVAVRWPEDFSTYEQVLRVGHSLSKPCTFADPLDPSLIWTAQDLRKERPELTSEEIALLIGSTSSQVELMLTTNVG
jgi:hypothetical protein